MITCRYHRGNLVSINWKWEQLYIMQAWHAWGQWVAYGYHLHPESLLSHLHDRCTSHFIPVFKMIIFSVGVCTTVQRNACQLYLVLNQTVCVCSPVPGFTNRCVCVEQLSCQSLPQWQFCSQASASPQPSRQNCSVWRTEDKGMTDGWRSLAGKYSIEGACCKGWQWAHSGRHNTVLRPAKPAACERSPASVQHSPLQQSASSCTEPGVITKSWTALLLTGTKWNQSGNTEQRRKNRGTCEQQQRRRAEGQIDKESKLAGVWLDEVEKTN